MAINCSLTSGKYKEVLNIITDWAGKARNKSHFKDPYEAAIRILETETMAKFEEIKHLPLTAGQVGSFGARLRELTRNVESGSLDNKWAQTFWLPTTQQGKKDPVVGSILMQMQHSSFIFRHNELRDRNLAKDILVNVKEEAGVVGLGNKLGVMRADKEYARLDQERKDAIAAWKNGEKGAHDRFLEVRRDIDELVSNSYLKVADEMVDIIETDFPRLAAEKYKKLKPKEQKKVDEGNRRVVLTEADIKDALTAKGKTVSAPMYKALKAYQELTENLYRTLRKAVDKRSNAIISRLQMNGRKIEASDINKIKDKINAKLMPNYEQGYFPHYTRDLNVSFMEGAMGHIEDMHSSVDPYKKTGKKPIRQIINDMNQYIDGHSKKRARDLESGEFDYQYSKNLMSSLENYIFDVNRFNYVSFMDAHYIDALNSVEKIYKTGGNAKGYAESLTGYITDMHMAANGSNDVSPSTRSAMRTLLGFEFISKLGVNPRGAVRNFTQRLLDYVTWGPVEIRKMKQQLETIGIGEGAIEEVLRKSGLLFEEASPQLLESALQSPASMFKTIAWNESSGKWESSKKPRLERIADTVSAIAGKSSWLHRKAENSNRKHTFKLAYTQMYRWLDTPEYRSRREEKGRKGKQVTQDIESAARRYAINMVVMNHFDYADYAKSKALRTNAGRFLGQFQHYSFEFFQRNLKIMREAKHDVLAGKLLPGGDARGLQQAYRMGLIYFLAPVVASAMTGVNFDNLVEHDTGTRINQLAVALTGDEDEMKEAFYGKGPLLATFGGPLVSDAIDIGVMLDLIDLDDDSIFSVLTGMEKYDPSSQSSDITRKLRLLNTFLGRATERHIPQLMEGRIGWAVQQELGLYPTAEARKIQRETQKIRKQILPPEIEQALRALEKRQ
jgi:hypothetical protein